MLLALAPLVGYGFVQAVALFAEASRSAIEFPELARGMTPLDGVLVPTLGAFYLAVTLLFPFVAIRAVGQDKQSGAAKLVEQFPVGAVTLLVVKMLAVGAAWCLASVPAISAIGIWALIGGHLYTPELFNLLLGHALYAFAITGIAFFAAAIADSVSTAAIVALAFTLGFWVLDFAAGSVQSSWLQALSQMSLTAALRQFEHGLFSLPHALEAASIGATLIAAAGVWLPGGRTPPRKIGLTVGLATLLAALLAAAGQAGVYRDVSEDRRNSFTPADEAALAHMDKELSITVYLSPDDSRYKDMEANVLGKLRRQVPKLAIRFGEAGRVGLYGSSGDDRYGLVVYEYAGKREQSRSSAPREILPILHGLAGVESAPAEMPVYPGYPLVADAGAWGSWFYLGLPILILLFWWRCRRPARTNFNQEEI
ncbi:MAG: ABC transporter permease [Betaproteobacteria bacterium]|nr:ABC transporter permease [Betaproteobacteria bacterium]